MVQNVHRIFDIDFIYFDLMLVTIWMTSLIIRKMYKQLIFGLFGYAFVHFIDAVIWFELKGTRHISIAGDVIGPHVFLTYFSFTYGMIMFSYATLMFDRKINYIEKIVFSAFLWIGWMAIAVASEYIHWNDGIIDIYREMGNARWVQGLMVAIEYLLLIIWKIISKHSNKNPWKLMKTIPWWYIGLVFIIGFYIHFSMESTLSIVGIRQPFYWSVFFFNSFLEFNTGTPVLFVLWILWNQKDYLPKIGIEELKTQDVQKQSSQL